MLKPRVNLRLKMLKHFLLAIDPQKKTLNTTLIRLFGYYLNKSIYIYKSLFFILLDAGRSECLNSWLL